MKKYFVYFPILLLLICSTSVSLVSAQDTTTFILIRHAEKIDDGTRDPALSQEGNQRALNLANHLKKTDISAVYSTPYRRTRQTVQAIADQKNREITEYNPSDSIFLDTVIQNHRGKTVLIVGHSNTIPLLVNQLIGEERYAQLDESAYDNLYILSVTEIGSGIVVHLTY